MDASNPQLYLCAGTQSSGSTLISWCFLQRADMDGYLDQRGDILPDIPPAIGKPLAWCKFTVNAFRLAEAKIHFEDEGWTVQPLLVVRDVRAVLNSLIRKRYGRNGVTAEEPPLRMRLRRFREDWYQFRQAGWATIRYESFVTDPQPTLRTACQQLSLPWDSGMLSWSKSRSDIAAPIHGNATFRQTRGQSLQQTVNPSLADLHVDNVPPTTSTGSSASSPSSTTPRAMSSTPPAPPPGKAPRAPSPAGKTPAAAAKS